jgi:RNA-directed DNA polymerase
VSPLLSNAYLHAVLDTWFVGEIQPRLEGPAHLVRFADDFVIVFASERDARRVYDVLPNRFGKYGLTLHPDKTRLLHFVREPKEDDRADAEGRSRGFDFLGFTHVWAKSRKGRWVVRQLTAKTRFVRALKAVSAWCEDARHSAISDQVRTLGAKLRGHYEYFGVTGNIARLRRFKYWVVRVWRSWLDRRSQKAGMNWTKFRLLLERYPLPEPVVAKSVFRVRR